MSDAPGAAARFRSLSPAPNPLPPGTRVTQAALNVRDLEGVKRFYTHVLGLDEVGAGPGSAWLGAGETPFLELVHASDAPDHNGRTGLFHLAILYPSRSDLAAVAERLTRLGASLQGASDHGVSEALYLADPEGNGLEAYRDRPESLWPAEDGLLAMQTLPLDLPGLLRDAPDPGHWRTPPETRIGHIHLRVSDVAASEAFYRDVVGLDLMQRYGPAASFLSAGGYHHHVGVNAWHTRGAPAPDPGALGLRWFRLDAGSPAAYDALRQRLEARGEAHTAIEGTIGLSDPSGVAVVLGGSDAG